MSSLPHLSVIPCLTLPDDYMTDTATFLVQNGISTGLTNQVDPFQRYLHDRRGLGAYTHVDVLYQTYFTAFLVMARLKFPVSLASFKAHTYYEKFTVQLTKLDGSIATITNE